MAFDPDAFNAFEAASWERQSATYDDFTGRVTSRFVEPLLDAAGVEEGTRVLDVATGPGYVARRAAARGASPVGVDIAPGMLEVAREASPELEFLEGAAEALPFPDDTFDAVVASFLVLHLGRPEQFASEAYRVLRLGGHVGLSMWDGPDRMRLIGVFIEALQEVGAQAPPEVPEGPPLFRFSDERELATLLRGAGFEGVAVSTVAFSQPVGTADELWDGMLGGTVRLGITIRSMGEGERARLREAVGQRLAPYATDRGIELPVSAKLASGMKRA
jgi:SAM-dependent methyltransferase